MQVVYLGGDLRKQERSRVNQGEREANSGCRCKQWELLSPLLKSIPFRAVLALGLSIKGLGAGNWKMQTHAACLRRSDFTGSGFSSAGMSEFRVRPKGYEPTTSEVFTKHNGETAGAKRFLN